MSLKHEDSNDMVFSQRMDFRSIILFDRGCFLFHPDPQVSPRHFVIASCFIRNSMSCILNLVERVCHRSIRTLLTS